MLVYKHDVLKFIAAIRASVSTRIQCYMFYTILKSLDSRATAYCNGEHIITKIDNYFYDFDGEVPLEELEGDNYLNLLEHYGENHAYGYLEARDGYNQDKIEEAFQRARYNYKERDELYHGDTPHEDIQLPIEGSITQSLYAKPVRGTQTGSL